MKDNKINITTTDGVQTLIIREGDAEPIHERVPVRINGTIDSVSRFLTNRTAIVVGPGYKECHVIVNKSEGLITLAINEHDQFADCITGRIVISDVIQNFGINSGKYSLPEDMAAFLKARKHHFESEAQYVEVFTALRAFKATVNQKIAAINDDQGNYEQKREQAVEHNIPRSFKLNVPIFKGMPKIIFEVEFIVNKNLDLTLASTELMQKTDELREEYINEEITKIEKGFSDLVILYQ